MTNGFGFKGFASGLQSGLGLGLERQRIKSLADERKALEKAKEEEKLAMNTWLMDNRESIENYSNLPQEERNWLIASSFQYSDKMATFFNGWDKDVKSGDVEAAKNKQKQWEDILATKKDLSLAGVNLADGFFFDGSEFDPNKPLIPPKDTAYLRQVEIGKFAGGETADVMARQTWKEQGFGELPTTPETPKMSDEKTAIDRLIKNSVLPKATYDNILQSYVDRGYDVSMYTHDVVKSLRETVGTLNLYDTPEEVMANVKAPAGMIVIPKRDAKTGKYYGGFQKKTAGEGVEGEITAGEKRTFDMTSSVMFGSSDWVTGISKPGIIPMDISNKLNMGQPLTEEENAEVRNNYNAIKDTLPNEVRSGIESQLKRYNISLEAPPPITPEPTPEPEPKKWWEFWKGEEPTTEKKLGPLTDMKGKPIKDYSAMTVEELYQLADKEDDIKAYEELKKRGKI